MLNKANDYYKNNKDRLIKQPRYYYVNFSEEEKIKERENGKNRYPYMSEKKNEKIRSYQKIIAKQKNLHVIMV